MGAALGIIGPALSIGGALFGSDTASQVQLPPQFYMPNMGQAADNAYSAIGNIPGANLGQWSTPQAQNIGQNIVNNPGIPSAQQGSWGAQALGQGGALTQFGQGQNLSGAGANLLPYAAQVAQMGFDPQNQFYDRALHNMTEQTRAGLAARGIGMTPYGAGVENKALSDFNIDWQNTALARAAQGAGAAGGLTGAAGNAITSGQALAAQAPASYLTASMMPYQTYQTIGQGQLQGLQGAQGVAQGGQQLATTPIDAYLAYIGRGTSQQGANNQSAQLGLNQAQLGFNQNQTLGSNLGAGLQGLGKADWSWLKAA